jgi:hypothetical protein
MNAVSICRTLLILVAALLLPTTGPLAADPSKEEVTETAAWLESLEWPDLKGKPYVEIMIGRQHRERFSPQARASVDELVDGPKVRGFLLAEDEKAFTLFADGTTPRCDLRDYPWPFAVQRIEKAWPQAIADYQVTSRVIELPVAVEEAIVAAHRSIGKSETGNIWPSKISPRVALFGLARWCAKVGRADLAARLDAEVLTFDGPAPFRVTVENEIAHTLLWKAMADLGELGVVPPMESVQRPELLVEFTRIARDFPGSADHAEAERLSGTLRKMMAEDETHAPVPYEKLMKMNKEEQAREWIFAMRDVQYFPSYMTDMPAARPADQLAKLGLAAVPALLEALEDPRLTRSIYRASDRGCPPGVMTFGDCAVDALSQIAARNFGFEQFSVPAVRRDQAEGRRRTILAWWQNVRQEGEKAVLIRSVRGGGGDAYEKAEQLREIDVDTAVKAVAAGLHATTSEVVRSHLLYVLEEIKSADTTALLRQEMLHSRHAQCRVDAAWELFERGEKDVAPAMLAELRQWEPSPTDQNFEWIFYPARLIELLGVCGDLKAMKALEDRLPRLPAHLRAEVAKDVVPWIQHRSIPPDVEALGERIAVSTLDDSHSDAKGTKEPIWGTRVCDAAAEALSKRWPQRYAFALFQMNKEGGGILAAKLERDAQIAVERNVWRVAHGLNALPVPALPPSAPEKDGSNVVTACHWTGGKALTEFPVKVGEALRAENFLAGLERLQRALPKECSGLAVSAERLRERRGFVVEIAWKPGRRVPVPNPVEQIHYNLHIYQTIGTGPDMDGKRAIDGRGYNADEGHVARIDAALKSDEPLAFYFESTQGR